MLRDGYKVTSKTVIVVSSHEYNIFIPHNFHIIIYYFIINYVNTDIINMVCRVYINIL